MRRVMSVLWLLLVPLSARAHEECLNHHWLAANFRVEFSYQFELMLVIIAGLAMAEIIAHFRRSKQ